MLSRGSGSRRFDMMLVYKTGVYRPERVLGLPVAVVEALEDKATSSFAQKLFNPPTWVPTFPIPQPSAHT